MIGLLEIRERGSTPRRLKKEMNQHLKRTWGETAEKFHADMRPKRFTPAHAREAGYGKRKGQELPRGTKAFYRSYFGRKLMSRFGGGRGRADPLVYTGEAKRGAESKRISATSKGVKVAYPGARGLNRRHPKSQINMVAEFRRVVPREAKLLATYYDKQLDLKINK